MTISSIALAALLLIALVTRAVIAGIRAAALEDHPETQHDFTASQARWGYLHDRRR